MYPCSIHLGRYCQSCSVVEHTLGLTLMHIQDTLLQTYISVIIQQKLLNRRTLQTSRPLQVANGMHYIGIDVLLRGVQFLLANGQPGSKYAWEWDVFLLICLHALINFETWVMDWMSTRKRCQMTRSPRYYWSFMRRARFWRAWLYCLRWCAGNGSMGRKPMFSGWTSK